MIPAMLSALVMATQVPAQPPGAAAWTRVSVESVDMPAPGEELGLVGFTLGTADEGFYLAPSLYGAVRGRRGGLLALGFEGGWRKPLAGPFNLQAGLFLGGGGGGAAPVGSGLMTRAHVGVSADLGAEARLGTVVSDVRWPGGRIQGRQLALTLERRFRTFHGFAAWKPLDAPDHWDLQEHAFEWTLQRYEQGGGLPMADGPARMREAVELVGVAWSRSAGAWGFYSAESSAAASGQAGGYMEVLAGGGLKTSLGERAEVRIALQAGSGGGGGLDTGGGFLVKGSADLRLRVGSHLVASLGVGQLRAPSSGLKATSVALKAGFRAGFASPGSTHTEGGLERQAWRLRPVWIHLTTSQREEPSQDGRAFDLVGLQSDWILGDHAYLLGQGAFACSNRAGAYATGLLGAGLQTGATGTGHRLVVELRAGAGGGAGMKTGGGALIQPMAGWMWEGRGAWGLQLLGGQVRSLKGGFRSTVIEAGLVFRGGSWREP